MRKLTDWLLTILCFLLMLCVTAAICYLPPKPNPQVQALQAEVERLRIEMEEVKSVQGFIVWEKDWRNRRQQ